VSSLEEKMAANTKDINLAFQAAEAALRFAENDLILPRPDFTKTETQRAVVRNSQGVSNAGYYTLLDTTAVVADNIQTHDPAVDPNLSPFYNAVNWGSSPVNYMSYTGSNLSSVARPPQYIVEELLNKAASGSSSIGGSKGGGSKKPPPTIAAGVTITYRITARGWGSNTNSIATVQSIINIGY
jgi:Tfp pilus assembly protein PilX